MSDDSLPEQGSEMTRRVVSVCKLNEPVGLDLVSSVQRPTTYPRHHDVSHTYSTGEAYEQIGHVVKLLAAALEGKAGLNDCTD